MDTHGADPGGTAGPPHGKPGRARPLPIEARRALWRRSWERLLAPPPAAAGDTTTACPDGPGTTRGDGARREGR